MQHCRGKHFRLGWQLNSETSSLEARQSTILLATIEFSHSNRLNNRPSGETGCINKEILKYVHNKGLTFPVNLERRKPQDTSANEKSESGWKRVIFAIGQVTQIIDQHR